MQKPSKAMICAAIAVVLSWTCLDCGTSQKSPHGQDRHAPRAHELEAIEGRVVDVDVIATRATEANSEIMELVTAEGDTLYLFTPHDLRCAPGTTGSTIDIDSGMTIRVYLRPGNVKPALEQYMPVEWAEVACSAEKIDD